MISAIPMGRLISGILLGVAPNGTYTSGQGVPVQKYKLGISEVYVDAYNQQKSITHDLEIFANEIERVNGLVAQLAGKHVVINPFYRRVKSAKTGQTFEFPSIGKDTQILEIGVAQ